MADRACGQRSAAAPRQVDDARARAAGIRKLTSKHLVLYTDLPSDPEIDQLPAVFDQAVPQWAAYFGVDRGEDGATGKRRRFSLATAAVRRARPDASRQRRVRQRHLAGPRTVAVRSADGVLSAAPVAARRDARVHGRRSSAAAGRAGTWKAPPSCWARTGSTSATGRLTLRIMPQNREEVPMLGRIKLIHDALAADRALALPAVMEIDNRQQLGNEAYAWCWAAAKFLDSHPRYRDRFRKLQRARARRRISTTSSAATFADDWADLLAEWQAFVATLDHGYDFERMAIDFEPRPSRWRPARAASRSRPIAAGNRRACGSKRARSYRVTAAGPLPDRANRRREPWPCEPGGVTIEYYDGRPLGMLLGAIDGREPARRDAFAQPIGIGLGTTITPTASGTLYLRVNDSAGRLDDNRGTLTVDDRRSGDRLPATVSVRRHLQRGTRSVDTLRRV